MDQAVDKIVQLMQFHTIMDGPVKQISARVVMVAIILAGILYFISLAYNYINAAMESIKDSGKKFEVDKVELFRTMILVGCIIIYVPLMETAVGLGEFFNQLTAPKGTQSKILAEYAEKYLNHNRLLSADISTKAYQELAVDPKASAEARAYAETMMLEGMDKNNEGGSTQIKQDEDVEKESGFNWMILTPVGIAIMILKAVLYVVSMVIKPLIYGLATGVLKVLICIGPLAFAFSILPMFRKHLEIWAGTVLTTLFVFTTLNILEHLQLASFSFFITNTDDVLLKEGYFSTILFDLVNMILYTMAFWMTGKVVGKGDAGRVLSKVIGTAAMAVGAAAGAGAIAASGSAGSAAGSAAQAGANVLGQDGE